MGAIEEEPFLHAVEDHLLAGAVEFDADHEAVTADFLDEVELLLEVAELGAEVLANFGDPGQKFVEHLVELEGDAASEGSAAEGGAMHAGLDGSGGAFVGGDEAERESAGDGFGGDQDVGHDDGRVELIGVVDARAADTGLDLIANEEGIVFVAELAGLLVETAADGIDAALALDAFDKDAASAFVKDLFEFFVVAAVDEADAGHEGLEVGAVLGLSGEGEGADGAAVEGIVEGDDLEFIGRDGAAMGLAHLESAFGGFGARVAEKNTLHAGCFGDLLGEGALVAMEVEVRGVDEESGLFADHFGDAGMGVAEGIDTDAGDEVEIAFAVEIIEIDAFAAVEDQRVAAVVLEQILLFEFDDLLRRGLSGRLRRERFHGVMVSSARLSEQLAEAVGDQRDLGFAKAQGIEEDEAVIGVAAVGDDRRFAILKREKERPGVEG